MNVFELFATIGLKDDGFQSGIDKARGMAAKAGKAIAVGLGAAATAFGDIGRRSVMAYADYEQLTGGVETLFGKSASVVESYAESAYKTANMSANQYMETITSFSASLLQGLGGDTEKAAEIGNMAVTDMADNANKMGTAIEAIQNAYQGFAKDNFTMLDNLKLGYGGTAGEMARLINDSGVLGDSFEATANNVKDIPFDKMVEAIHAVQTEMGITGTTALEASETISGSWNTLKSSWTNVLTSLASGNKSFLDNSINALVSSTGDFADNVMGAATNVVNGITQLADGLLARVPEVLQELLPVLLAGAETLLSSIVAALPAMMEVLSEILPMAIDAILTMLPEILQAGIEIITQLALGIANALPELIPAAVDAVITLVETLVDNVDMLVDAAIAITIALAEGIISALPTLIEKAPVIVTKLVDAIVKNAPKLLKSAFEIVAKLASGIIDNLPEIDAAAAKIISTVVKGISDIISDVVKAGGDVIKGFWNGINNAKDWLVSKISGFFDGIVDSIKSFFGIKSPSRLMRDEVGVFIVQGIAEGIEKDMSAEEAAKKKAKNISDAFKTEFDKMDIWGATATLEYKLWEATIGQNATPAEKDAQALAFLDQQHALQAERVSMAQAEYQITLENLGAQHEETQRAYNKYLQSRLDLNEASKELEASREALSKNNGNAMVEYAKWMAANAKMLEDLGFSQKEIEAEARRESGYDPDAVRAELSESVKGVAVAAMDTMASAVQTNADKTFGGLVTEFGDYGSKYSEAMVDEISRGVSRLEEFAATFKQLGIKYAESFIEGLKSMSGHVNSAFESIFREMDGGYYSINADSPAIPNSVKQASGDVTIHQHIQAVPLSPYELATQSKAAFQRARWVMV